MKSFAVLFCSCQKINTRTRATIEPQHTDSDVVCVPPQFEGICLQSHLLEKQRDKL